MADLNAEIVQLKQQFQSWEKKWEDTQVSFAFLQRAVGELKQLPANIDRLRKEIQGIQQFQQQLRLDRAL